MGKNIYVLLLALVMVSCAPTTTTFYRPAALDGKVVSAHCPPVESFILFETQGVLLGSKASRAGNGLITMTITFEIPKDRTVTLLDQEIFSIQDDHMFASGKLRGHFWVSAGRTKEFSAATPMPGRTEKKLFFKQITLYGTTQHAYYFFTAQLAVPDQESFTIKLPNYSIDGIEVISPKIRFTQDTLEYMGPLNC